MKLKGKSNYFVGVNFYIHGRNNSQWLRRKSNCVNACRNLSSLASLFSGSWRFCSPSVSTHVLLHSICQWALSRREEVEAFSFSQKRRLLLLPFPILESTSNKDGDVLFAQDFPGELEPQRTSMVDLELVTCDQSAENIMILFSILSSLSAVLCTISVHRKCQVYSCLNM